MSALRFRSSFLKHVLYCLRSASIRTYRSFFAWDTSIRGGEDEWFDEERKCVSVCKKKGKCSLRGLRCLGVKRGKRRRLLFCTSLW